MRRKHIISIFSILSKAKASELFGNVSSVLHTQWRLFNHSIDSCLATPDAFCLFPVTLWLSHQHHQSPHHSSTGLISIVLIGWERLDQSLYGPWVILRVSCSLSTLNRPTHTAPRVSAQSVGISIVHIHVEDLILTRVVADSNGSLF